MSRRLVGICTLVVAFSTLGCEPPQEIRWELGDETVALDDEELRNSIASILEEYCGTPASPRLLQATPSEPGKPSKDDLDVEARLKRGYKLFMRKCQVCHGVSGDGQGPAAEYLDPKPRDYRKGVFKFTSTLYGIKPVRADLVRVIRKGAKGTSMPAFPFLSDEDVEAIIDYVLVLAHRGELERSLLIEVESEGEIDPEFVPDIVAEVLARWSEAQDYYITPLTQEPLFTEESIALGKRAFFSRDCVKCHGPDGSGKTRDNVGVDTWGNKTRAANLTAGMFHGGHRPIDIYRRIATGINGTPMPQFLDALREEPDTIWHLVHFVMTFSDRQDKQTPSDGSEESPQVPVASGSEVGEDTPTP